MNATNSLLDEVAEALPDSAPRTLAAAFMTAQMPHGRHFRGDFYARTHSAYRRLEREVLRSDLAAFLAEQLVTDGKRQVLFQPNARRINDVLDALATISQVRCDAMPAWLDSPSSRPLPENVIAFRNGLLDVAEFVSGTVRLMPPNPEWFSTGVLPFDFDGEARDPEQWWDFLTDLWPEDAEAIELLQEWFGYTLAADTRQQKILLVTGPKRSGKGTIARILTQLVGPDNVAGPTLAGLTTNFGLSTLLSKTLAIVGDARLGKKADQSVVVERLLSISGEDALTIDRKFREPVTLKLPTRITLLTNELPKLGDASGALADRFLILVLKRSFLGEEDTGLTDRLSTELPGILMWALNGLRRLHQRGKFIPPASGLAAHEDLRDLISPIHAFVREQCTVGTGRTIPAAALYEAWIAWCAKQGRDHPGTVQSFGRDLRATMPEINDSRPRDGDGNRIRIYEGIGLNLPL